MITARAFAGKHFAVLGLARSGMAVVESLLASGARVTAWDKHDSAREALEGRVTLADPLAIDLAGFDAVVVSPGVPLNTHPLPAKAEQAGVRVIGDIELFAQARAELPAHKVVGITGTNGKSTTTALVHHILSTADIPTTMGGNIGLPILAQDALPEGGIYVLELSSYQIDLTFGLDCDVAVLLNVTPDHLDRYDNFAAYRDAKLRLFAMQSDGQEGFVGDDTPHTLDLARLPGIDPQRQRQWPTLAGPHNAQNAAAAAAICAALGLSPEKIEHGLKTYPGLPHRMERIGPYDDILFINDSKATNPASTAPALAAYTSIHWICGGLAKDDNLDECAPHFDNIARAYTIGDAAPLFVGLLDGHVPVENCEMLTTAIRRALRFAAPGDVIMLSPACASFDQFRDFEHRGETFRNIVEELAGPKGEAA